MTDAHLNAGDCQKCHAVCWKSVLAGAVTAAVASLVLFSLGSGVGFSGMSLHREEGPSMAGFTIKAAIWMIVMQWLSAGFGGYLTGRLLARRDGIHDDEAFFRDTAHGFLTWAVATLFMATVLAAGAASVIGGGVQVAALIAAGPADRVGPADYYADALFRGAYADGAGADTRAEAARILMAGLQEDVFPGADEAYLVKMVSRQTGLADAEASARVSGVLADVTGKKQGAKEAADKVRKSSAAFSVFTALSMVIGGFVAAVAAALGGTHRNRYLAAPR